MGAFGTLSSGEDFASQKVVGNSKSRAKRELVSLNILCNFVSNIVKHCRLTPCLD